jgi:tetratricopeptide (TPR) repeat protein
VSSAVKRLAASSSDLTFGIYYNYYSSITAHLQLRPLPLSSTNFLTLQQKLGASNRQQRAWLSGATSPIDVTVTKSTSSLDSENENTDDNNEDDHSAPKLSKSQDQIIEEHILSLQSELRTHHRHAAYSAALDTATELLERCTSHFGKMHPATASAYNNIGLMNKLLGNYANAKEAFHESLQIYGEVCGKDHSSYAAPLFNVGMLERSRVLESEAEEGEDNNDADVQIDDESNVELETLRDNNNTSEQKAKLSALERMQLNESAIEYFDEAYRIRLSELGNDHPLTVQSLTQLGSAIAAAVISERKGRMGGLIEGELRKLKQHRGIKDPKEMEQYIPEAIARAASKSAMSSKFTQRRWDAAEDHLRMALKTAVENPRGEIVEPLAFVPIGKGGRTSTGLTLPKKDRTLSKKERKIAEKERKREKRRATEGGKSMDAVHRFAGRVSTLSAATAAQNLAVFLKHYSDWVRLSLIDEAQQESSKQLDQIIDEARYLYEAALHVRSQILPPHHPEVVASKFSLAELLDSTDPTSSGRAIDSDRANWLREAILESYDIEERD